MKGEPMNATKTLSRKAEARKRFDGSERLFNACWRELNWFERNSDTLRDGPEVEAFLHDAASRRVNNSGSGFYLYGE
jgi:hypothetical protein